MQKTMPENRTQNSLWASCPDFIVKGISLPVVFTSVEMLLVYWRHCPKPKMIAELNETRQATV